MIENKEQKSVLRSLFSARSSLRSSQSSQLMGKVPNEMRTSLKKKKSLNQNIGVKNFYEGFKYALNSEAKDCSICLAQIRHQCSISDCNHKFCSQCVVSYITFKINSMEEIICPDENCDRKVDFMSSGWKYLPQEYKDKYKKQQLWRQTIKNPDLKLCPKQKCKDGTINLRKIPPVCQKCHAIFCQECMMQAHPNKQCDQNFRVNFKEWKRCPKCQMFIEKTEGCNHMVCRCKNEFCFVCLEPWTGQHYACVEDQARDFIDSDTSKCPKIMAIFMVLIIPLMIAIALVLLALAAVGLVVGGFFVGTYFTLEHVPKECLLCGIVFCPIIGVILALVALIWGEFFYLIPVFWQYFAQYRRNIRNLWNYN